jgi:hypothetical protein
MTYVLDSLLLPGVSKALDQLGDELREELAFPLYTPAKSLFGSEALFIQLLATWSKFYREEAVLVLPCETEDIDDLEELYPALFRCLKAAYGICAVRLCGRVVNQKKQSLDKHRLLVSFRPVVDAMYQGTLAKTSPGESEVNLVCFTGAAREFIKPFYREFGKRDLVARITFFDTMRKAVLHCVGHRADDIPDIDALSETIGQLAYELVENTEEHATNVEEVKNGVRGILLRHRNLPRQSLSEYSQHSQVLGTFVEQLKLSSKASKTDGYQFLELSTFDSGQGLVKTYASNTDNIPARTNPLNELEVIETCFQKYMTRKQGTGVGIGLTSVIAMLARKRGFIVIRTGSKFLVQSFQGGKRPNIQSASFAPTPWDKRHESHQEAVGVSLTVLIPLA